MNERIKELEKQAWDYAYDHETVKGNLANNGCINVNFSDAFSKKFAELIIEDVVKIMKQEWYEWNNAPKVADETPRDIGLRVGAKGQTILLMHLIKEHFGSKKHDANQTNA